MKGSGERQKPGCPQTLCLDVDSGGGPLGSGDAMSAVSSSCFSQACPAEAAERQCSQPNGGEETKVKAHLAG